VRAVVVQRKLENCASSRVPRAILFSSVGSSLSAQPFRVYVYVYIYILYALCLERCWRTLDRDLSVCTYNSYTHGADNRNENYLYACLSNKIATRGYVTTLPFASFGEPANKRHMATTRANRTLKLNTTAVVENETRGLLEIAYRSDRTLYKYSTGCRRFTVFARTIFLLVCTRNGRVRRSPVVHGHERVTIEYSARVTDNHPNACTSYEMFRIFRPLSSFNSLRN